MTDTSVSDGMGGWIDKGSTAMFDFNAHITPVTTEIMLKNYGIVSTRAFRVITKKRIELGAYIEDESGSKYKVLQLNDFNKLNIMLVEVM